MFGVAMGLLAFGFVAICIWKIALLFAALARLGSTSVRRRPLLAEAIRGHTLHLLLAAVGIALLLLAQRLPGEVYLYLPPPAPPPMATATGTASVTPSPTPTGATPTTTTAPPMPQAMRLNRLRFKAPPFGKGHACDDDGEPDRMKRQVAINAASAELGDLYARNHLQFVLVVGTFDHTSLSPATSRRYDSNTALAQERAECVARLLIEQLHRRAPHVPWERMLHTMIAGPQHARSRNPDEHARSADRNVRILVGTDAADGGNG